MCIGIILGLLRPVVDDLRRVYAKRFFQYFQSLAVGLGPGTGVRVLVPPICNTISVFKVRQMMPADNGVIKI